MAFESFEQIVQFCQEKSVFRFAEAVIQKDMKDRLVTRKATLEKMRYIWNSILKQEDHTMRTAFPQVGSSAETADA